MPCMIAIHGWISRDPGRRTGSLRPVVYVLLLFCAAIPGCRHASSTAAESFDLTSAGLVANDPAAAGENTRRLRTLVAPANNGGQSNRTGWFHFPRASDRGTSVYFFNDVIPVRDDVHLDLRGCTLRFDKTAEPADQASGFLMALRKFSLKDGCIEVHYRNDAEIIHAGAALMLGTRASAGSKIYFPDFYDSEHPPLGEIQVSDLRIITHHDAANSRGILMLGALRDVTLSNITIEGQGVLRQGIIYEFGEGTRADARGWWKSSHAEDLVFRNITIRDLSIHGPGADESLALTIGGAFSAEVDGLFVSGADTGFYGHMGEAAYYSPHVEYIGQPKITLRNVRMDRISTSGLVLTGAGEWKYGYLGKLVPQPSAADQTDHLDFDVEDFFLCSQPADRCSREPVNKKLERYAGFGVSISARKARLRNGTIIGFSSGVAADDDCTELYLQRLNVLDSAGIGLRLQFHPGNWNPPRLKRGYVRDCFVAGSGSMSPGDPALTVYNTIDFHIERNVFGYPGETTQGSAVYLGEQSSGVVVSDNEVRGIMPGQSAYRSVSPGNILQANTGHTETSGPWIER